MIAVAPVYTLVAFSAITTAAEDAVPRLLKILNTPGGPDGLSTADREEAAMKLVNRDSPDARDGVRSILLNIGNPAGQIAIAKALSQASNPDPTLVSSLGKLLGPNKILTDAAGAALANYRDTSAAFDELRRFADAPNGPIVDRISVIRSIGTLADPEPANAQYLIELASQANQNTAIKDAATEALGEMTGQISLGKDIRKWQQWWAGVRGKNVDQFRAMLLQTRAPQFNQLKQRNAQLTNSINVLLKNDYLAIPAAQREAVLLSYLSNRAPDVRIVGIELVGENIALNPPPQGGAVRERLFALIGDNDDKVRLSIMLVIPDLNDHATLNPLLTQLGIETNPNVKQSIARALGELGDVAAVPALVALLQNGQSDDVIAAAKAFSKMGQSLRKADPAKADDVSTELRKVLAAQQNQAGNDELRAACMNALAALRDSKSFDTFMGCFNRGGEIAEVRAAALVGLGNLGDHNADETVAHQLDDPDPRIRALAAIAMKTVATPGQDGRIFDKMNSDPDPDTRKALWEALQKLYEKDSPAQLKHWANLFEKDPDKKLITLERLGDALKREKNAQDVALNEQAIADAMMSVKPPRAGEAIAHLQSALDYWRGAGKGAGGNDVLLESLVGQLLNDKLATGQWTEAADFAAAQISNSPAYQPVVAIPIRDKIDQLKETQPAEAQKLIDAALAMKPPLDGKYIKQIQEAQAELKQRP